MIIFISFIKKYITFNIKFIRDIDNRTIIFKGHGDWI